MNSEQAMRVLKILCRAHLVTPDASLLDVWYNAALEKVDYGIGLEIARDLAGSKDRMPKPVHFNDLVKARNRHPANQLPATESIPFGAGQDSKTPEVAKQHLAEMRAKLQR